MSVKYNEERPYQRLPDEHSIIHFGGDLLTIQNGVAFVAVHYHSYFSCRNDEVFELSFM